MSDPSPAAHEVTQLLHQISGGDASAVERLVPLIYAELRQIAERAMRHERSDHTLQPTALVHEAFLRLVGKPDLSWESRAHFLNIAALAMRRVLLMHARERRAGKRGGGLERVTLDEQLVGATDRGIDLIGLDESLERLAAIFPRKARVVELRFFAGLSLEETGKVLDISLATVKREWDFARAWIRRDLAGEGPPA
jgi:RNA polymerase sigma factor (TIGR02999 family)